MKNYLLSLAFLACATQIMHSKRSLTATLCGDSTSAIGSR